MTIDFDFQSVSGTEFGVGINGGAGQEFYFVPSDGSVQAALLTMAVATRKSLMSVTAAKYEPSEKHGTEEPLYLPLNDSLASVVRNLHEANNLPTSINALSNTEDMFCYFARFSDSAGKRLTGVRRATQFKGVLKSHLISFITNSMKLVPDKVFKLDKDFDFLVDSTTIQILRPSGFEFVGRLQAAILSSVPQNVSAIQSNLSFIDFAPVEKYAKSHARAARYLASVLSQPIKNTSRAKLRALCKANGVDVQSNDGKIVVSTGYEMGFLEVLDRRRYELELVEGSPERYRAGSRSKVS